ncbi:MAG: GWxTD domain-containing protein [Crocinitomicaceae bacterium]|nr:GWxTD domain-containing protein [Crocinitomicaceae bacterium]
MNKFFVLFLMLSVAFGVSAQKKKQLKAYLDYKSFYEPSIGNYVEIQLQFVGHSIQYVGTENGSLQGEIAVKLSLLQNDSIIVSDAYRLQSPIMRDSIVEDFYDIKRFAVKPGVYSLAISIQDLNLNGKAMEGKQVLEIKDFSTLPSLSDIQVSERMVKTDAQSVFFKAGYEMMPRISNYFSAEANALPIYLEMYNFEKVQAVGLKQLIINTKTKEELEDFSRFSKHDVDGIQPLIRVLDLTNVPSGEYQLQFSMISKEGETLSSTSYYFERTNNILADVASENLILDPAFQASIPNDSLEFYVKSLIPIAGPSEVKNIIRILKTKNTDSYRKYIQAFWVASSGVQKPYDVWLNYKKQVLMVQKFYASNFMDGFETDRGRVYLQYGPPNNITSRETSPSEYPYEIWVYDRIKNYSNKRFVFYNPDLVNNAYRLLHSDMIGELQNYRWQQQLSKRNSPNKNIDDPNDGNYDSWGGNSRELYEQH